MVTADRQALIPDRSVPKRARAVATRAERDRAGGKEDATYQHRAALIARASHRNGGNVRKGNCPGNSLHPASQGIPYNGRGLDHGKGAIPMRDAKARRMGGGHDVAWACRLYVPLGTGAEGRDEKQAPSHERKT